MQKLSSHERIKLQITAFLFNIRADALRGEIYKALCLHVLTEAEDPCTFDEIVELVAYAINPKAQILDSLRTILSDELTRLRKDGEIIQEDGLYKIDKATAKPLPNSEEEANLNTVISAQINILASSLKPNITKAEVERLLNFYFETCSLIVNDRVSFIIRGVEFQDWYQSIENLPLSVAECRTRYQIDDIIDADEFIYRTFINAPEVLSSFVARLIQVHIIMQLLTWDPKLEYLRDKILGNKIIYLDTSALFVLVQKTDLRHNLLTNLLRATCKELGATLKVHQITIQEYEQALQAKDFEFHQSRKVLQHIARLCKNDGTPPEDILDDSLFADYIAQNIDHVDPGTWQIYKNLITGKNLIELLESFSIQIDKQNTFVPEEEFHTISNAMLRASSIQVEKGIRPAEKTDTRHDTRLFYLIKNLRTKTATGFSLGYDTYLLTLDGSLIHFSKLMGIPWTETYFIFPNQWYEMAFPFLRLSANESSEMAGGFTALAFSSVFPTLNALIPLGLFSYIFDLGGTNLSVGSVKQVVEALVEQRLIGRLDPSNKDELERERAVIQVQRIIAETEMEQRGIVDRLKKQQKAIDVDLQHKQEKIKELSQEVETTRTDIDNLEQELNEKKETLGEYEIFEQKLKALQERYDKEIKALKKRRQEAQQESQEIIQDKEESISLQSEELTQLRGQIDTLQSNIKDLTVSLEAERKTRAENEQRRQNKIVNIRKVTISAFFIMSLVVVVGINYVQTPLPWWAILSSVVLTAISMVIYLGFQFRRWAFTIFCLGLLVPAGTLLYLNNQQQVWQWIIPIAVSILLFGVDKYFDAQSS